ncbi:hypothetical protein GC175_09810 [bacterium]|nr:hypothetical protein [bacterium]
MSELPHDPITDELLSAYIDGDVTEAEKRQVEYAIANDPDVAWQVETLRQTVDLLRDLPTVPFTRSFVIHEEQVADVLALRRGQITGGAATEPVPPWRRLLRFLNGGNLLLRNASVLAAALFLVVSLGRIALDGPAFAPMASAPEMTRMQDAAPAAFEAAPASSTAMEAPLEAPLADESAADESAADESAAEDSAAEDSVIEDSAVEETEADARTMALESRPFDAAAEDSGDAVVAEAETTSMVQDQNADTTRKTAEPERADDSAVLARQSDTSEDASSDASTAANAEEAGDAAAVTMFAPALESAAASAAAQDATTETARDAAPTVPALSIPSLLNPFQWLRPAQPAASAPASEGGAPASDAPAQAASGEAASAEAVPLVIEGETPTVTATPTETPTSTPSPTPSPTQTATATAVIAMSTPTAAAVALSNAQGEAAASTEQIQVADRPIPAASSGADEGNFWSVVQLAALGLTVLFFVLWLLSRTRHKSPNRTNRA